MSDQSKISKHDFVTAMVFKIITSRHLKPLNSNQRKELGLKSSNEAEKLQQEAVYHFCQSCTHSGLNIRDQVEKFTRQTKKQRLELYAQVKAHALKIDKINEKLDPLINDEQ